MRRIASSSGLQIWRLSFTGGAIAYQALSASEARALLAEKRGSFSSAGFPPWIGDIGDLLQGIMIGVIDVADATVTSGGDSEGEINAAITIIVNGVTYLFETLLTFVEQAFDVVQAFFAKVGVSFEKIFEWLGFLFDWQDIVLTQQAIVYVLNQFFSFLQGGAPGIQSLLDNGIANVSGQLESLFESAIANIAGSSTIGSYVKSQQQPAPEFYSAVSNNVLLNGVIDNASATTLVFAPPADNSPIAQFIAQVQTFVDATDVNTAFSNAVAYFQNLGGNLEEILSQLLSGLFEIVESVLRAILSGVQSIADGLLELVQALFESVKSILGASLEMPFVTQLYSWITNGAELTMINLFSLILAIPATILYKAEYDEAPFSDGGSVSAFENSFDAQTMLQSSGLNAGDVGVSRIADVSRATVSLSASKFFWIAEAAAMPLYGLFSAAADAVPPGDKDTDNLLSFSSWGAFVMECAAQACAWFELSGPPDCTTADGTETTLWCYECVGIGLDAGFLIGKGSIPESWSDAGVGIAFLYGVGHTAPAILASKQAEWASADTFSFIIPLIPEWCKMLRLSSIVNRYGNVPLGLLASIDILCSVANAVSLYISSQPSPEGGESVAGGSVP